MDTEFPMQPPTHSRPTISTSTTSLYVRYTYRESSASPPVAAPPPDPYASVVLANVELAVTNMAAAVVVVVVVVVVMMEEEAGTIVAFIIIFISIFIISPSVLRHRRYWRAGFRCAGEGCVRGMCV